MNRFFITAICLMAVQGAKSQDLATKIPHDAFAVVNIQTDHFFKLINVEEFNQTVVGQAILKKSDKERSGNVASISDFGVKLDQTAYFYTMLTDSVTHFNFLFPLSDAQAFESRFAKDELISEQQGFKLFTTDVSGDSVVFAWNESMLAVTSSSLVNSYFEQEETAARYGITNYNYSDYYEEAEAAVDSAYSLDELWFDEEAEAADSAVLVEAWTEEADTLYDEEGYDGEAVTTDEVEVDSLDWSETWDYDSESYELQDGVLAVEEDDNPYEGYYAADQAIKKGLAINWAKEYAALVFEGAPEKSILTNPSYLKSLSKDALVSAWVSNFEAIYTTLLPEFRQFSADKLFSYYGSFQLGLFADKEGLKIKSSMELDEEMAKRFKRMYGGKLNRQFLKYINTDDAIGFFSIAMNSQAYLEELPVLMKDTYGGLFAQYDEDISLGADLLSLIIDEKALSGVAKGDALFVLNGITEKEVPYTTYEYDDDYNYQEIESTKMETIPDFLLMFSSDDAGLYNRLMSYLTAKDLMVEQGGVYTLVSTELPFELLFMRKNGIVFIGTSAEQLTAISTNRYKGKLDKHAKNLLLKNKTAGLLSAKKTAALVDSEELASLDNYIAFRKIFGSMGDFYFSSKGIEGNRISGEFVAQSPAGYDNAIQYIFSLMEYVAQ